MLERINEQLFHEIVFVYLESKMSLHFTLSSIVFIGLFLICYISAGVTCAEGVSTENLGA